MVMPKMSTINHTEIKIKNKIFAIAAAPAAIPVNPSMPATMAIIRKRNDHLNIKIVLMSVNNVLYNEKVMPKKGVARI